MQKLHLVGFTTDLDGLIFSARKGSKAGGYMVPLDKALLATIAEAERLRNGEKGDEAGSGRVRARPDSRLTPREIQAHVRAGRSVAEVAAEAGVDVEWVERFAVPVIAEQAQMVERARGLTYSKARLGQSTQPLGTSVRWNLVDKGVAIPEDGFEQGWSAFQLHGDVWMIRFRYTSRARLQVAEWELDVDGGELHSRNRLASELGYVEKGRRAPRLPAPSGARPAAAPPARVSEEVAETAAEPDDGGAPAARRATTRRRATRRPAKKGATSRKAATKRPAASKKKAPARKTAVKKRAGKRAAVKRTAVKTAAKKTAVKQKATPRKATARKRATSPKRTRKTSRARKTASRPATRKRPTPAPAASRRVEPTRPPARAASPPPERARPARAEERARKQAQTPRETAARPDRPTATARPARPVRTARPVKSQRPRIAGAKAGHAATKRSGHAAVRRTKAASPRSQATAERGERGRTGAPMAATGAGPALSGPLARGLLARRLMARKAAEGDGNSSSNSNADAGRRARRPLRVR